MLGPLRIGVLAALLAPAISAAGASEGGGDASSSSASASDHPSPEPSAAGAADAGDGSVAPTEIKPSDRAGDGAVAPTETKPSATAGKGRSSATARGRSRRARPRAKKGPAIDRSQYKTIFDERSGRRRQVFRAHRFLPVVQALRDPAFGTIIGLRARYVNRLPDSAFNRIQLDVALRLSTRLIQDHDLRLQLRDLLHRGEVMLFGLYVDNDPAFPYLGVANNDVLAGEDLRQPYYAAFRRTIAGTFAYAEPLFEVPATPRFPIGRLRWFTGATFAVDRFHLYEGSLLEEDRPEEEGLRPRVYVVGGFQWDRRDNEWNPTTGAIHEASFTLAGPGMAGSRAWGRFNASARWYRGLGTPKLVFAQAAVIDAIIGLPPLIPMGELGGLEPIEGLGGRFVGRGFYRRRFVGDTKAMVMTELRYLPLDLKVFRWTLGLGVRGFVDLVKVFRANETLHANIHPSVGGGVFAVWDRFLVMRLDAGYSAEGAAIYLAGEHPF